MEKHIPYLCGGTLFLLLKTARKGKNSAKDHAQGIKDLRDCYFMDELVYVVTGAHNTNPKGTLKTVTSNYINCRSTGNESDIPFGYETCSELFKYQIENEYSDLFKRTTELVNGYLDIKKIGLLGKYLLGAIFHDSMQENEPIYYDFNGSIKTKAELLDMDEIFLQPLLIGILRFILDERKDNAGEKTLEIWGEENSNHELRFKETTLGSDLPHPIKVVIDNTSCPDDGLQNNEDEDYETVNTNISQESSHDIINRKLVNSAKAMGKVLGEAIDAIADQLENSNQYDDQAYDKRSSTNEPLNTGESGNIQIIQNQKIVNQSADKIYNIDHIDHIEI